MNFSPVLQLLQQRLPNLMAVYAFGSQVSGNADKNSDLDLAVLVAGYADVIELWDISSDIAELANCEVDLLDFRAASTLTVHLLRQILTTFRSATGIKYLSWQIVLAGSCSLWSQSSTCYLAFSA